MVVWRKWRGGALVIDYLAIKEQNLRIFLASLMRRGLFNIRIGFPLRNGGVMKFYDELKSKCGEWGEFTGYKLGSIHENGKAIYFKSRHRDLIRVADEIHYYGYKRAFTRKLFESYVGFAWCVDGSVRVLYASFFEFKLYILRSSEALKIAEEHIRELEEFVGECNRQREYLFRCKGPYKICLFNEEWMVDFLNRLARYEVGGNPNFGGFVAEKVVGENVEEFFIEEVK